MKQKKTLAEWIRWFNEMDKQRLQETTHQRGEAENLDSLEEVFTVIVPEGAPATDLGRDLRALNGVRWAFEWTMVPGPETLQ
jgi:hypothetical protein